MPQNTQYDSISFPNLMFPYNRILNELDETPRFVRGQNAWVTIGGKLQKRPGTIELEDMGTDLRMDNGWIYETQETPPVLYILGSFFNPGTSLWEMAYFIPGTSTAWVSMGTTRSLNASTAPHEVVFSRGLAFIKSYPAAAASDKSGATIFDGSGGSPVVRLWGIEPPTEPARISGRIAYLDGDVNSSTTTINVQANFSPAVTAPFVIQVDYEQMEVTSTGAGTNWTVTRAVNGTVADSHDDGTLVLYRDWSASAHRVDVNLRWQYAYAYKSVTEQISNRSELETNPDLLPSSTGPFFDLIPKITVTGHADTTNIPEIIIYRTQDGGGTFFELETIPNTGVGSITYLDDSLESGTSGGTFNDPIPDDLLDQASVAPTLTSNSPPPTVLAPLVTGVDPPAYTTPIVSYANRLWYGIGNTLFFSGNEEISEGVPEECFPSGLRGNAYKFAFPIINLAATNDAVYVFTLQRTYTITGTNLETFNPRSLYDNIGAPYGHPRAVCGFGRKVAFLTHDYRLAFIEGDDTPRIVSDPLFTDFVDAINAGGTADIKYWGDLDKEYIVVSIHNAENPGLSKQWFYDLKLEMLTKREFWNVPWNIRSVASLSGRIAQDTSQRRLCFFIWDPDVEYGRLVRIDPTNRTYRDVTVGGDTPDGASTMGIDFYVSTHLHTVPPGNHVNALRVPALDPVIQFFRTERTLQPGDQDPDFFYYLDDFWSDPFSVEFIEDPPRRSQSIAYKTIDCHINQVAHRIALEYRRNSSTQPIEIQNYAIVFNPDGGT